MNWARALLALICAVLAGCDSDAARLFGLAAPLPPKPALAVDLICDGRGGGTCNAQSLAATCDEVLPRVAERPGSRVTLWNVGETVADTAVVASVTAPDSPPRARRAIHDTQACFISTARATLLARLTAHADGPAPHRTPLAEAITRIAWAGAGTPNRTIIVITDGREVSDFADMECGTLPTVAQFVRDLTAARVLTPGTLARTDVQFAFVTIGRIDRNRCAVTLERADAIRSLWTAALKHAGATRFAYHTGTPQLNFEEESSR